MTYPHFRVRVGGPDRAASTFTTGPVAGRRRADVGTVGRAAGTATSTRATTAGPVCRTPPPVTAPGSAAGPPGSPGDREGGDVVGEQPGDEPVVVEGEVPVAAEAVQSRVVVVPEPD